MVVLKSWGGNILLCSENKLIIQSKEDSKVVTLPAATVKENEHENIKFLCLSVSRDQELTAVSCEDKQVLVLNKTMNIVKNFSVGRIPSCICFTPSNSLIVADKTGDVFMYNLKCEQVKSTLLLGHMSIVLDVLITPCGKYIITCDRDEKIRVSNFPNAYNIQSFCLGHKEFVISLKIVEQYLISASGDGTIRFWNYLSGQELLVLNTNSYIDEEHFKCFFKYMDSEDIEVSALPITDMQVHLSDNIFIGVSLFQCKKLLLFSVDYNSLQVNFCKHIQTEFPFSFLLNSELFILTSSKIICYILHHQNFSENKTVNVPNTYNSSSEIDQTISLLYKKRFDNVAEYFKTKKARQELK